MSAEILKIISPGWSASIQDLGRVGWRRFGVPSSGVMDRHAAGWANKLLGNPPQAPVLELLLHGGRLEFLQDVWIVLAGADTGANIPLWKTVFLKAHDILTLPKLRSGVWSYLAVEGGFAAVRLLGSASVYSRGRLGRGLAADDILARETGPSLFTLADGIVSRSAAWSERRNYNAPPPLRVWPGPQWDEFSEPERDAFFAREWTVSSQSDRVGYRLEGTPLNPPGRQLFSEPVRVGSIQIPSNGLPIVTMRDGPTVGGYHKLGLVDPRDLCWLTQCAPGTTVRFIPVGKKAEDTIAAGRKSAPLVASNPDE